MVWRTTNGGLPFLEQSSDVVPDCGGRGADPRGLVANELVQLLYFLCGECRREHAFNN